MRALAFVLLLVFPFGAWLLDNPPSGARWFIEAGVLFGVFFLFASAAAGRKQEE